jgi:hypothetical protein
MFPVICLGIYHASGNIEKYIIFKGSNTNITDSDIFSNEELENIHDQSITLHYSTTPIHPDDTIYLIKQKILHELKLLKYPLTMEEIYLFYKQNQILPPHVVFESILHSRSSHTQSDQPDSSPNREHINAVELAQLLTNYGLQITPELETRIRENIQNPELLETFSYEDWKTTWPWNNEVSKFQTLGQRPPLSITSDPLLSAHPFLLHYQFLQEQIPTAMNTTETELLMNYIPEAATESTGQFAKIVPLYMASAESVLEHFQTQINQDNTESNKESELIAFYFPHLYHTENVRSYEDWKQYSAKTSRTNFTPFSPLDVFYELYENKPKLPVDMISEMTAKKGITSFLFSIPSQLTGGIQLPLEYIFRQSTATKHQPYLQYNPGHKQEILYRLYSEKMAQNGKKIPYLEKDVLKRWAKQFRNKHKSFLTFALFPSQQEPDASIARNRTAPVSRRASAPASFRRKYRKKWSGDLFLRVYANGELEIEGNPTTPWNEYSLESFLIESITPVLRTVNTFLESSGYTLPAFQPWLPASSSSFASQEETDIFEKEVHIGDSPCLKVVQMSYEWVLESKQQSLRNLLEEKRAWLSSAFYYTSDWNDELTVDKKGGPMLTFQRVENFQSMETENQWVAYYVQQKYSETQILEKLQSEHALSKEGAVDIYTKFLQEFKSEQRNQEMNVPGRGWKRGHRQTRVKHTNPGFPTVFQFGIDDCRITVENICDFTYLNTLQVYIHFLQQLSQLPAGVGKRLTAVPGIEESIPGAILETEALDEVASDSDSDSGSDSDSEAPVAEPYVGTDFSESSPQYFYGPPEQEPQETEEPEEESEEESESEAEAEDDESVSSQLSELNYDNYEEEEDDDTESKTEKGGKKKHPSKKQQNKLEKQILGFLQSSMTPSSKLLPPKSKSTPPQTSGAPPLLSQQAQFKNQNVSKYWLDRMKKRDPGLFEIYAAKEKEIPNFKAYPRTCQINDQRQPILINEEEKQRIDREHPGSYTYALPFKSSETAPEMYYICPRYWCFKTGTSMTEEEVQQGKCGPPGNAVPSNFTASTATKNTDTSLVHFNNKKQHRDQEGNYVPNNPGFIKRDGICMPCCFKRARPEVSCEESRQVGEYTSNDYIITDETKRLEPMKWGFLPIAIQNYFHYFPALKELMDGKRLKLHKPMLLRYGVEQFPNQSFLGVVADWYVAVHKLEDPVSVEEMRDILSTAITLDQFLQYNNGALVTAFRAAKTAEFQSKSAAMITSSFSSTDAAIAKPGVKKGGAGANGAETENWIYPEEVDYTQSKYSSSLFVQRIQPATDPTRAAIVNDTIASYENFLQFLKNPASEMDPTYLWDVISQPNPKLFPKGYNLVLLSLPENDLTQNVDLICPSTVYSSQIFDTNKESAIVLLHHGFYEPIYVLERTDKDKERITKFFLSKNSSILNGVLRGVMKLVRETIQNQCSPKPSTKSYTFERPIYLSDLVANLKKLAATYRIVGHVWNYSGKIIGLQVAPYPQIETVANKTVVVPCFPTSHTVLLSKHEANRSHRFIDDKGLWVDFPMTLQLLRKLHKDSSESKSAASAGAVIPCLPIIEVVEEQMIVGILTQTNQFIAIQPPVAYQSTAPPPEPAADLMGKKNKKGPKPLEKDLETQLMVLRSTNPIEADVALSRAPQPDPERERWTRDIRLENKFYQIFRSTARLELNRYENRHSHKQMIHRIHRYNQGRTKYRDELAQIAEDFRTLLTPKVAFITFEEAVVEELYRISAERDFTPCSAEGNAEGESANQPYCLYANNGASETGETQKGGGGATGKLLLPKQNRVNETADNETGYFQRLADELLRFPRIQSYLLFPTSFLTVESSEYKIKPTEIILLQSVLVPESGSADMDYFQNLKPPSRQNRISYEFTDPLNSEPYSNLALAATRNPRQKMAEGLEEEDRDAAADSDDDDDDDKTGSPANTDTSSSLQKQEMVEQQRMIQEYQTFYDTCVLETIPVIGSTNNSPWKRMFSRNRELVYRGTTQNQSFCCIMNLVNSYLKRPLSLNEMKKQLVEAYRPWMNSPISRKKIRKILRPYNAPLVRQWNSSSSSAGNWEAMFFNETYIFTELDFWVLGNEIQLPVILFTANRLKHLFEYQPTAPPVQWILVYPYRANENHYFVRIPSEIESGNLAPKYSRIQSTFALELLKDGTNLNMGQQVQDGLRNPTQSPYAQNVVSLADFLGSS